MGQKAYIVAGYRSAVGKAGKGGFRFYRPDDLAADVIKHLMASVYLNWTKNVWTTLSLEMLRLRQNKD